MENTKIAKSVTTVTNNSTVTKCPEPFDEIFVKQLNNVRLNSSITEYTIPEDVGYVHSFAFKDCASIEKINVPGKKTEFGTDCFNKNRLPALRELEFNNDIIVTTGSFRNANVKTIKIKGNIIKNDLDNVEALFAHCDRLNNIELSDNIDTIGDNWFDTCYNLENVKFPSKLRNIYSEAFNCTRLSEFKAPSTIEFIDNRAFAYCPRLKIVDLSSVSANCEFGSEIFTNCLSLEKVTMPNSNNPVNVKNFTYCNSLKEVICNNTVWSYKDTYGNTHYYADDNSDKHKNCGTVEELQEVLRKITGSKELIVKYN